MSKPRLAWSLALLLIPLSVVTGLVLVMQTRTLGVDCPGGVETCPTMERPFLWIGIAVMVVGVVAAFVLAKWASRAERRAEQQRAEREAESESTHSGSGRVLRW